MKKIVSILSLLLIITNLSAQKSDITLEDIWRDYKFYSHSIGGLRSMNDGVNYTSLDKVDKATCLVKHSYVDQNKSSVIVSDEDLKYEEKKISIDDYNFSADESKLLVASNVEQIYRYSSKADYYIYDLKSKNISKLHYGEKQMYATFSPLAKKVAFVKEKL